MIEENRQCMGLLFEEVDRYQRKWEDKVIEMQEDMDKKLKTIYDELEEKIERNKKKSEISWKGLELKSRSDRWSEEENENFIQDTGVRK